MSYPRFLNVPCNAQLCKTTFLIQIHHLLNFTRKTCCAATLFQLKSLHLRLFPTVLLNPFRCLLFLGLIPATIGAVHGASFGRKRLSTMLAPLGGSTLQSCIQFRIVGQHALPEILTHGISAKGFSKHHALAVQRQAAVILM